MKNPERLASYFTEPDVHDAKFVGAAGGITFVAALLFLLGHGLNAWLLFSGKTGFGLALAFHLALSVIALILARFSASNSKENRFFLLLFITTSTLSIFGAGGMMVTVLLHQWYMRFAQPFSQWFASIFPHSIMHDSQRIYDDIVIGRDEASKTYSVIPFVDVLWYGSESQKRMALSKMTSRFDPSFAPAFRKALNDSSNTIRVQAATAITKIENQFLHHLMKLVRLQEEKPGDPVLILALAEHYDDYAFTGILDVDRERHNREEALKYYMLYLDRKPNETDVRSRVGRLMLRSGESARAADWLRTCIDEGHQTPTILTWYVEALYASGRYGELRQLARSNEWSAVASLQPKLPEALNLWVNGSASLKKGEAA